MGTFKTRIDITGERFGRLTVVKYVETNKEGRAVFECKCDCGNIVSVVGKNLRTGNTKSCGCFNRDQSTKRIVALNTKHGSTNTRLFRIWASMKTRCGNKNTANYEDYGGRGIFVCDEWKDDFAAFEKWALENGYNDRLSIDRIDNDKGYFPENCRWATMKQQQNNRRSNRLVEYNGEIHTVSEWAEMKNLRYDSLLARLNSGRYTVERALTEPQNERGKYPRRKFGRDEPCCF